VTDGRHERRQSNRAAVVQAVLDLYADGRYDCSAADVAERAGLSPRSLFRYFEDTEDLARAAIEHQQAIARPLLRLDVGPDDDLATRIAGLVEARTRMWLAVAPAARAARMRAPVSPVVSAELHRVRSLLRRQVAELFAVDADAATVAAVDVLVSFESLELLLHEHRFSRVKAKAVLVRSLHALLAPGGLPS
jgi:AcrR family transcriptional regulator